MNTSIAYRQGGLILLALLLVLVFAARPLSAQDNPAPAAASDGGASQDNFVQIPNEPTSVSTILDDYE